jgi:hypothetical protein
MALLLFVAAAAFAEQKITIQAGDARLATIQGRLFLSGVAFTGNIESRYPSGNLQSHTAYQDGLRHGQKRTWYDTGDFSHASLFVAGRRQGTALGWWSNGQLQYQRYYEAGLLSGETLEWNEAGVLQYRQHFIDGREEGLQQGWHDDGELAFSYVFKDGRRYGVLGSRPCFNANPASESIFNADIGITQAVEHDRGIENE